MVFRDHTYVVRVTQPRVFPTEPFHRPPNSLTHTFIINQVNTGQESLCVVSQTLIQIPARIRQIINENDEQQLYGDVKPSPKEKQQSDVTQERIQTDWGSSESRFLPSPHIFLNLLYIYIIYIYFPKCPRV